MDWLDFLKQLSVLIGIWVAIYGIDSWRREHTGKRQIELAEDTLALFYEAAEAIRHIRHPASLGRELKDIERQEHETDASYEARRNASIVYVRYNLYRETFNKLYAMRYRFMAQIGKDKAKPFEDLKSIVDSILVSANALARLWPRQNSHNFDAIDRNEKIFWDTFADDDQINIRLKSVIDSIEITCRSTIAGKGSIHGVLNSRIPDGS